MDLDHRVSPTRHLSVTMQWTETLKAQHLVALLLMISVCSVDLHKLRAINEHRHWTEDRMEEPAERLAQVSRYRFSRS